VPKALLPPSLLLPSFRSLWNFDQLSKHIFTEKREDHSSGWIFFDLLSKLSTVSWSTYLGSHTWLGLSWDPSFLMNSGLLERNREWYVRLYSFVETCISCIRGELRGCVLERLKLRLRVDCFVIIKLSFEFSYLVI
jgi:hypothetical protein